MLAVIFIASLLPPDNIPKGNDKLFHFLSYAILAWWFVLAFQIFNNKPLVLLSLKLIAFSGLIEILQDLSGYRYAEWYDLLANTIGVVVGVLVARYFTQKLLFWVEGHLKK